MRNCSLLQPTCLFLCLTISTALISQNRKTKIFIDDESLSHYKREVGHMMSERQFLLCFRDKGWLQCPKDTKIFIRNVFYGQVYHDNVCNRILLSNNNKVNKTCEMRKAELVVRKQCHNAQQCRLHATAKELDMLDASTCHGLFPYLSVTTFCQPDIHVQLLCSDSYLKISCSASQALEIVHARITNKFEYENTKCVNTVKASSGMQWCPDEDMTAPMENLCKGRPDCHVKATFPPNEGCARTHLLLVYSCLPIRLDKSIDPDSEIKFNIENSADARGRNEIVVNDQSRPVTRRQDKVENTKHADDNNPNEKQEKSHKGEESADDENYLVFAATTVGCGLLFVFLLIGFFFTLKRRRSRDEGRLEEVDSRAEAPCSHDPDPEPVQSLLAPTLYVLPTMEHDVLCQNRQRLISSSRSSSEAPSSVCSVHGSLRSSDLTPNNHHHNATVRFSQHSDLFVYQPNSQTRQKAMVQVPLEDETSHFDVPCSDAVERQGASIQRALGTNSSESNRQRTVSNIVYTPRGVSYL